MRQWIKARIMYCGLPDTDAVRAQLQEVRRPGYPYCPPDEGDTLYRLARATSPKAALEVGFATGSTAAYMLTGLDDGNLTSIDFAQDQFKRQGEALVASMGFAHRHRLIEDNSIAVLPDLHKAGERFGLIFLDGWKSFDHIWVDTFYCARLLECGGYMVFDDARMPAVRKCISLLMRYYGFQRYDTYGHVGGWRQRLWHLLTTRSLRPPYVALRKTIEISETEAGRHYYFWKRF